MLNPIEEAKFAELKNKCRELKVPSPSEIMIKLKVHDKNGILTFDDIQRGHSWTRNYYNMIFNQGAYGKPTTTTFGAGYISGKTITGGVNAQYSTSWAPNIIPCLIRVGTSDTAFSVEQYALGGIIEDGSSSGKLTHVTQATPTSSYISGTKTWKSTIDRVFNNNSGAIIIVKEVALYSQSVMWGSGDGWMPERSVLDPTVSVANGAQLTVTYEISMDFSAID